jgi:hypothetical protein
MYRCLLCVVGSGIVTADDPLTRRNVTPSNEVVVLQNDGPQSLSAAIVTAEMLAKIKAMGKEQYKYKWGQTVIEWATGTAFDILLARESTSQPSARSVAKGLLARWVSYVWLALAAWWRAHAYACGLTTLCSPTYPTWSAG